LTTLCNQTSQNQKHKVKGNKEINWKKRKSAKGSGFGVATGKTHKKRVGGAERNL
jgi:hypothetical protein